MIFLINFTILVLVTSSKHKLGFYDFKTKMYFLLKVYKGVCRMT